MPPTRDELHRLIDELPTEVIERVRNALLASAAHAYADTQRHQERLVPLVRVSRDELEERSAEVLALAADLQALTLRLREVEWISPEYQRAIPAMQALATELAASAMRHQLADWQNVEAAHERGEVTDPLLLALLNAPEDDEVETDEERAAVEEAHEATRRGETRSWEDVRRELEAEAAHG